MQPTIKELEEKYNKMRDDQILNLLEDEGMREDAIAILEKIKKERGIKNHVQKKEGKKEVKKEHKKSITYKENGRVNRLKYWLYLLLILLTQQIFSLVLSGFVYLIPSITNTNVAAGTILLVGFILGLSLFILLIVVNTKRCNDIGKSGVYQLIPFYVLFLLFKEGDRGDNDYGPQPATQTKLKTITIVILIPVLLVIVSILAVINEGLTEELERQNTTTKNI